MGEPRTIDWKAAKEAARGMTDRELYDGLLASQRRVYEGLKLDTIYGLKEGEYARDERAVFARELERRDHYQPDRRATDTDPVQTPNDVMGAAIPCVRRFCDGAAHFLRVNRFGETFQRRCRECGHRSSHTVPEWCKGWLDAPTRDEK